MTIKEKMNKADLLQQWSQKGVNAFTKGGNAGEGVPLVVQFTEKPSEEARSAIRLNDSRFLKICPLKKDTRLALFIKINLTFFEALGLS